MGSETKAPSAPDSAERVEAPIITVSFLCRIRSAHHKGQSKLPGNMGTLLLHVSCESEGACVDVRRIGIGVVRKGLTVSAVELCR